MNDPAFLNVAVAPRGASASVASQCLHVVDRFLRFGALRVVRVDVSGPNDAVHVDHQPRGHGQRPASFAVVHRQVHAEARVDFLEIVGELEPQSELRGVGAPGIRQDVEADAVLLGDGEVVLRRLRRYRDDYPLPVASARPRVGAKHTAPRRSMVTNFP